MQDQERFRKIVKGKIRQNLKKYIVNSDLTSQRGKDIISIPVPHINLPKFKFNEQLAGGVGQGSGDVGDPIGNGQNSDSGQAGQSDGNHAIEVEISIDEMLDILGEELELPNIIPKGERDIDQTYHKYNSIQNVGPEALKNFKRTYAEALKRQISAGEFDPDDPIVIPEKSDKRYRSTNITSKPHAKAVIIYMMDISGSMEDEQKEIVRTQSFWIDAWLNKQYKGLESRFIVHDTRAQEVNRDTFFKIKESGGTMISSAFKLCKKIIEEDYPLDEWNVYLLCHSDGDNWSSEDTSQCIDLMKQYLVPWSNMFAYSQVKSPNGSGKFIIDLKNNFQNEPKVILTELDSKTDIMQSIKNILGKGH